MCTTQTSLFERTTVIYSSLHVVLHDLIKRVIATWFTINGYSNPYIKYSSFKIVKNMQLKRILF